VLIGDAAHIFQPHTGQGVSQTLEDVACLTGVLRGLVGGRGGEVKAEELEKAFRTFEERRRPRV
jgi:2-polyprenyl-6-methoxyphenol hydroxylase-like FAD-dependent oxidoreductase